jgi:phosphatidylinositol glycan class Q protein
MPIIGVSFQIAFISDVLNLLTIHATCFYGYARAIYKMEMDSLKSLFRLFRGKKVIVTQFRLHVRLVLIYY